MRNLEQSLEEKREELESLFFDLGLAKTGVVLNTNEKEEFLNKDKEIEIIEEKIEQVQIELDSLEIEILSAA